MIIKRSLLIGLLVMLLVGCVSPTVVSQTAIANEAVLTTPGLDQAVPAGQTHQFPVRAELRHARAFTVEYRDSYKVVTILQPWRDAGTTFTYILVQRGTQPPQEVGDAQVIEIPIQSIASLSTTHLPYLDEINELDTLTAVGNVEYINMPGVLERIQNGKTKGVGNGPEVNLEMLLEVNPEVITTLALGNPQKDDYQQLMEKGFKAIIVSDYMEETPLGRAEWVKFMALFYNQEAQAEEVFSEIEERYKKMQTLTANVSKRPTVMMGFEINGNWNMPGGQSYQAAYIRDAGGEYLWADDETTGRIPLSFEAVYEKGAGADFWFNQSVSWQTAEEVLAADSRYSNFSALEQGHTYNNNARLNVTGGNDYNESGHAHPDLILADLISIMHPELLPDHTLVYYRRLTARGN